MISKKHKICWWLKPNANINNICCRSGIKNKKVTTFLFQLLRHRKKVLYLVSSTGSLFFPPKIKRENENWLEKSQVACVLSINWKRTNCHELLNTRYRPRVPNLRAVNICKGSYIIQAHRLEGYLAAHWISYYCDLKGDSMSRIKRRL